MVIKAIGMKNIFKNFVAGMIILATATSCEDNANWVKLPTPQPDPTKEPSYLVVPGNHQGWEPAAAVIGKIYSVDNDGVYSGYVYLDGDFKCCTEASWDGTNYGLMDGVVSTDPTAGNLTAEKGYYWLMLNTNTYEYSLEKREWGVIGDATAGGWNEDVDMEYDPADLKLKTNITLTDGVIKFRVNDDWVVNLGGDMADLKQDGDNISVQAGEYQVVLDLSTPTYKAELVK